MKRCQNAFTLVEIMVVVVIIGLLAAMAIPAFKKVTAAAQDKAVLNNVRQLGGAADQYYLEHGVTMVGMVDLIGQSYYIKAITPIARENYPAWFTHGITLTVGGVAGARTITYSP